MAPYPNRRQFLCYGAATLGTSLLLKACGTGPSPDASPEGNAGGDLRVAMVLPGVITDKAWNEAGYNGLEEIKQKLGAETAYVEQVKDADQTEALADFARRGFSLVYAHGGQFDAAIAQIAPQFPDTFFIGVNGAASGSNVAALRIDHLQASYLCGIIAATMSQSGKLAYIAGQEFQATQEELRGLVLGAQSVKPDIQVASTFTGDWNDAALAKEAAEALISTGVDVVYQWLDNASPTVLQTAAERDIYAFGNTADQFDVAPQAVLTSAVKRIDLAIAFLAELATQNQLQGQIYSLGLDKPEILYLGQFNPVVPSDLKAKVEATKTAIADKKLTFEPCTEAGKTTRCPQGAVS